MECFRRRLEALALTTAILLTILAREGVPSHQEVNACGHTTRRVLSDGATPCLCACLRPRDRAGRTGSSPGRRQRAGEALGDQGLAFGTIVILVDEEKLRRFRKTHE